MESHSDNPQLQLSIMVWIAAAVGFFAIGIYGAISELDVAGLFIMMMVAAMASTIMIWMLPIFGNRSEHTEQTQQQEPGKAKREGDDRLALLLSLMDDDEREAFKAALKQRVLADVGGPVGGPDDGELPYDAESLETLLYSEDAERRLAN